MTPTEPVHSMEPFTEPDVVYVYKAELERLQRIEAAARALWDIAADDHVALTAKSAALATALGGQS